MPGGRFSAKEDREASHVAASERARGMSAREAKRVGYATVEKRGGGRKKSRSERR
jgi:hypothetical protein